jgi:aminopeptidase N
VHRITEVRTLRARQFTEDAGPLAHPVRPSEYREINNFYTATVYEKGAEIIRMLKTLLGAQAFSKGMDLYFERYDGTAATIEDFLACFAEVSGRDLSHFALWYAQAGTPRVAVTGDYDAGAQSYRLDFAQSIPATPGQPTKQPAVIPIALGIVAADGSTLAAASADIDENGVFEFDAASASVTFTNVTSRPVPSVFRGFSAPVRITLDLSDADLLALLRYDTDPFNRWQSAQTVATRLLTRTATGATGETAPYAFAQALLAFLTREGMADPAFAALALALPSEAEIAQEIGRDVDPDAIHEAREEFRRVIGITLAPVLASLRADLRSDGPYSPDAASAGRRALRNAALDLLAAGGAPDTEALVRGEYEQADNMTDKLAALSVASHLPARSLSSDLFSDFRQLYANEPLVLDKWFALQAIVPADDVLALIERLMADGAFSMNNPNRVRSLIGTFALSNPTQFHRLDGAGYDFVADKVIALDAKNPQVAARILTAFNTWRVMEPVRRARA